MLTCQLDLIFVYKLFIPGICYLKFSKTSEAALAMEEMNGQTIGNHLRPLKVMIAHR